MSVLICAFPPVLVHGCYRCHIVCWGLLILQDSICDLLFVLSFSLYFHTSHVLNSLSNFQFYSVLSFKLLPRAILCVYSSILCVYLVHPRDSLFPRENHKEGRKLTPFSVHLQPGGSRFSFLQGLLLTVLKVFYGSLKHPRPHQDKAPAIHGELLTQECPWVQPSSLFLPSFTLFSGPSTIWVPFTQFNYLHERLSSGSASWRNPIT